MDVMTISTITIGVLFGISEALSYIPAVKANGVFQLFWSAVRKAAGKSE